MRKNKINASKESHIANKKKNNIKVHLSQDKKINTKEPNNHFDEIGYKQKELSSTNIYSTKQVVTS